MSLKRKREWRDGTANSTQEASARLVYGHTLTFKGKESAFSFPELIQLCGSFSPALGCVDKELVLFSRSDTVVRLYLGTASTSSSVNRPFWALLGAKSRPGSAQTEQKPTWIDLTAWPV